MRVPGNILCLFLGVFLAVAGRAASPAASPGVKAAIQVGKQRQRVVLLGRRPGGLVLLRHADSGATAAVALDPKTIKKVRIRLNYDRKSYNRARRRKNWTEAGTILTKSLAPALPFIDLQNNNLLSPTIRAATYFMRAGARKTKGAWRPEDRQAGEREYHLANALLRKVMQAEWSPRADTAALLSVICLVALNKSAEAEALLAKQAEPDFADDDYGLYRLARATLLAAKEKYLDAIEEAVAGIAFETKDIDTFPDTLMLSAYCYEKLGDWYRARDVYYEVARLFQKTRWEEAARTRLEFIMTRGYTKKDESVSSANVFFGIEEDVNAGVDALLHPEKYNDKKETTPAKAKKENKRK
jgi:tetratricopeptide (TPR) repeat protein